MIPRCSFRCGKASIHCIHRNLLSICLFAYRENQWMTARMLRVAAKKRPTAVGTIQLSSYSPVSVMQSDWAMSGDFHISSIATAEVSTRQNVTHSMATAFKDVHIKPNSFSAATKGNNGWRSIQNVSVRLSGMTGKHKIARNEWTRKHLNIHSDCIAGLWVVAV